MFPLHASALTAASSCLRILALAVVVPGLLSEARAAPPDQGGSSAGPGDPSILEGGRGSRPRGSERPAQGGDQTSPFYRPIRGMTVSCPIYGEIWGRPAFSRAAETLRALGVEWVALHPYGRISRDGTVSFTPAAETGYLPAAVDRASRAGVHLFWKPHLAYWGSFEWRGAIDFGDDRAAWDRFFETYRSFILDHARFAARAKVPLLAIGVELERTMGFERQWRDLIGEVRAIYPGRITYAANWDGVDRVQFWNALDYVGVQAYFPLELPNERRLSRAAVRTAWAGPLAVLDRLAKSAERPVLITEIGYPSAAHAASTPWKPEGFWEEEAAPLRAQLVEVALELLDARPSIAGMFWWKWMPGRRFAYRDFSMQTPDMRSALRRHWGDNRNLAREPEPGSR